MNSLLRTTLLTTSVFYFGLAHAGYGPAAIGLGTPSVAMGGADLARSNTAFATIANPAGLTRIKNSNVIGYIEFFSVAGQEYRDSIGNNSKVSEPIAKVFGGAVATRLGEDSNWLIGIGGVAQGGIGYKFDKLTTTAGNQDELSALFGIFRIAPSIGWQATEKLSLGASFNINLSQAEQKVFPNTSIAPSGSDPGFAGIEIEELSGITYTYRLGIDYQWSDAFSIAATYSNRTPLRLENGKGTINYPGLGKVNYDEVSVRGLSLASELGVGFAYQATDRLQLAADVTWFDWSRAFRRTRLQLSRPDNASAPQTVKSTSANQFRDQFGVGIGGEYQWSESTKLRAGFTYGRNPIPDAALSPIFGVNSEYHITAGFAYNIDDHWKLHGAVLYVFPKAQKYENTTLPLGQYGQVRSEVWDFGIAIERDW